MVCYFNSDCFAKLLIENGLGSDCVQEKRTGGTFCVD